LTNKGRICTVPQEEHVLQKRSSKLKPDVVFVFIDFGFKERSVTKGKVTVRTSVMF
jgi:hypothetical protein